MTSVTPARLHRAHLAIGLALASLAVACAKDPARAAQEYLRSGNAYADQGKYQEAIVEYRNALQHDARFGDARLQLARAYEQLGDLPNAYREYVRAADALPQNVATQLKAGQYLMLARQFEDARARAQAVLEREPRNLQAQILLGNALGGLQDFDAAIGQLEQAVELDPTSAAALAGLGAVQTATGRTEAAEAAFRQAVESNPAMAEAHLAYANFLWSRGRVADAETSLKQTIAIEGRNLVAHRALATMYITTRRAALAEPHLRALADADDTSEGTFKLALADYYVLVNRPDDAMRILEGLAASKDAAAAADTRRAAIEYVRLGRPEGHRRVEEVLARDPRHVPALLVKARFLATEGQLDQALEAARAAADADAQSIQARYLMGTILRAQRKTTEAIAAFGEVLKINPTAAAAQLQLAQLNMRTGDRSAALQMASDAARQLPQDPRAQETLIHALVANDQLEQAQRAASALLESQPNASAAHAAAGAVALARRDTAAARRAYTRAVELDATSLDAVNGLVRLDILEKKPDAARARVERLLAARADDPNVLSLAARVYATTGDLARSETLLRKAIEVDPASMQAYGMLGQIYAAQKRLPEARASFEAILKERPEAVNVHTVIAMLHETEGNADEARKRYERILQIDPGAAVAANNLAYRYTEDGVNLDRALELAQIARQKLPDDPDVADTLGWIYVKKNLASLALPHLEAAVAGRPQAGLHRYHLGVALVQVGQRIRGRQMLERALTLNPPAAEEADARRILAELPS